MADGNLPVNLSTLTRIFNGLRSRIRSIRINNSSSSVTNSKLNKLLEKSDYNGIINYISLMSEQTLDANTQIIENFLEKYYENAFYFESSQYITNMLEDLPERQSSKIAAIVLNMKVFSNQLPLLLKAIEKSKIELESSDSIMNLVDKIDSGFGFRGDHNNSIKDFTQVLFEKLSLDRRNELFEKLLYHDSNSELVLSSIPVLFSMLDKKDRLNNYKKTMNYIRERIAEPNPKSDRYILFIKRMRKELTEEEKEKTLDDTIQLIESISPKVEKNIEDSVSILEELTPDKQKKSLLKILDNCDDKNKLVDIFNQLDEYGKVEYFDDFVAQIKSKFEGSDEEFVKTEEFEHILFEYDISFGKLSIEEKKKYIHSYIKSISSTLSENNRYSLDLKYRTFLDRYMMLEDEEKKLFFYDFLSTVAKNYDGDSDPYRLLLYDSYIMKLCEYSKGLILYDNFDEILSRIISDEYRYRILDHCVCVMDEHQVEEKYQEILSFYQERYKGIHNNNEMDNSYVMHLQEEIEELYLHLFGKISSDRRVKEWKNYYEIMINTTRSSAKNGEKICELLNKLLSSIDQKEDDKDKSNKLCELIQSILDYVKSDSRLDDEKDSENSAKSSIYTLIFSFLPDDERIKQFNKYLVMIKDKENVSALFRALPKESKAEFFRNIFLRDKEKEIYVIQILKDMSEAEIVSSFSDITLSQDYIKRIMAENEELSIKPLLFDKDLDRKKLYDLTLYDQLQNKTTVDVSSILKKIYSNKSLSKEEINQRIDNIYNLFTYNNIPEFLKTLRIFQLSEETIYSAKNDRLESIQDKTPEERDMIFLRELFVLSLCSNNQSLRRFLNILQIGKNISTKLQGNPEKNFKKLKPVEVALLSQYRDTLFEIYNITNEIKQNGKRYLKTSDDVVKDLNRIITEYARGDKYDSEGERKSSNYVVNISKIFNDLLGDFSEKPLTVRAMLEFMDKAQKESQERHEKISDELEEGKTKIQEGDWVKGIKDFPKYFPKLIRTELKGGEFNQEDSHSDATELDCDFGYIVKANINGKTAYDTIMTSISAPYGETWIVLRNYDERIGKRSCIVAGDAGQLVYEPEYYSLKNSGDKQDRYARVGVPVSDIDYIVTKEWSDRFGYEMAMAGVFIPVVDEKGKLLFSKHDYKRIISMMTGLTQFGMDAYDVEEKVSDMFPVYELYKKVSSKDAREIDEEISTIEKLISGKSDAETKKKKSATVEFLSSYFQKKGISVSYELSMNLSSSTVELIDTGSTGRGTNLPGDGDFDFTVRHNLSDGDLVGLQEYVEQNIKLGKDGKFEVIGQGFRVKDAILPTGECVDIDCVMAKKSLEMEYSSDLCVRDRLNSIKEQHPEYYNYVVANIIMAKKILKELGIYKKIQSDGHTPYGGFGGIGVENWILQNGGSFAKAIDTYLEAAEKVDNYQEFIKEYPIFDFGSNHRGNSVYIHDRYSAFLGKNNPNNLDDPDKENYGFNYVKEKFKELQKILQEKSIEKHNKIELILPIVASSRELAMNGQLTQTVDDKLVNAIKEAFGFSGSAILLSKYAAGIPVSESISEHEEEDKV